MAQKMWAYVPDGVVSEVIALPSTVVPGVDLYTPEHAAEMHDVTDVSPAPQPGWVTADDGKTFSKPPPAPVDVPLSVSSAQAKIQCHRTPGSEDGKTLLDDIMAAVQAAGGEAHIWFTDGRVWERSNPYVASLSAALKLKPEDVDQLFIEAAQIAA